MWKYDLILLQVIRHYLAEILTTLKRIDPFLSKKKHVIFSVFTSHTPLPKQHAELGAYLSPLTSMDGLRKAG